MRPVRLSVYTKIQYNMQWTLSATAGCWSCVVLASVILRAPVLAVLLNLRFLQPPASITKELLFTGWRRLLSLSRQASTGDLVPVFSIFPTVIPEACIRPHCCVLYELCCEARSFFCSCSFCVCYLRSGSTVPAACTIPGIMFCTWSTKHTLV